jgi:hypothetical protein
MKALSLWQPWASLWAVGRKKYETRHWATSYRGPLVIHAAQKLCIDIDEGLVEICCDEFGGHWARELPRGALLATCRLINCISTHALTMAVTDEEFAQGDFTPGRYAWEISELKLLERPIPFRGHQSLFDVPDHILGLAPLPPASQLDLLWTPERGLC